MKFGDPRLPDRFWAKVEIQGECWIWIANGTPKYGRVSVKGKMVLAHVHAYEVLVGPVPEGLQLDHTCRVPRCVRPKHLEPVTGDENVIRGYEARKGLECEKCGTPYEGRNRSCKTCRREYKRLWAIEERRRDPERQRARDRRYYEKMMSTAEGRERLAAKQRRRHT